MRTRYHIDMEVVDRAGVLSDLSATFAQQGISLRTVRQEENDNGVARLIVVTHSAKESLLHDTVEALKKSSDVKQVHSVIRLDV